MVFRYSDYFLKGNHVSIITTNLGKKNVTFSGELASKGVDVFEIRVIRRPFIYHPADVVVLLRRMMKADIIYVFEPPPGLSPLIALSAIMTKRKTVRGRHNPFRYESDIDGRAPRHLGMVRLYESLNLFFDRLFTVHHVQNSIHRDFLIKNGFRRVVEIPACIDLSGYRPSEKFDRFTVLFLGRMNYHKGTDRIPKIVQTINEETDKIRILIAGSGIFEEIIRRELAGTKNVEFLGLVDEKTKLEMLSRCHVLVSPTRVEAFMLTGIEAMASGTPVISFPVPGPSDYIKDGVNGFLCDDERCCALKTIELFNAWQTGNYSRMSSESRKTGERYSCDNILPMLKELFQSVVNCDSKLE
ncbi:MAG: glycosyltransferase family 4 protein [Thermoplasmata archaeon]|uniref:Glycosyltransferase family 4 protein n=1 Tax=Candidatus Sysuiplasma superficiale TaxID=2823368 RepID=A0A8J8CES9_9ARCH|nr:glycosyltransferase family 4 protein [Candidatus Sysuiplasma superficiale]MBX8644937.1 glycosyltransferase family 4 protein [Candidatus Sysuiplasma superficiale]